MASLRKDNPERQPASSTVRESLSTLIDLKSRGPKNPPAISECSTCPRLPKRPSHCPKAPLWSAAQSLPHGIASDIRSGTILQHIRRPMVFGHPDHIHVTPIGKAPPLAVRLTEALPFRRAQGIEERRTLNIRPPAYGRRLPDTYPGRAGLWRGDMARMTSCASANGSRGFAGPSGPCPALLAPSGGLPQTTRSAGST